MTVLGALLLAALAFVAVAYPLFRQRPGPADPVEDERLLELRSKRDATYSAIKELEFDFKSGSLSEQDYHDLDETYKRKAISTLKELDDLEKGGGKGRSSEGEDEIERQIMAMRRPKKGAGDLRKGSEAKDEIEEQILAMRQTKRGVSDSKNGSEVEDEIDKEVLVVRQTKKSVSDSKEGSEEEDKIERQGSEAHQAEGLFCPQCGTRSLKGDRFCVQCGASLSGRGVS